MASSHFGISSDAPVFCCGRDQTGVPRTHWSVVRCGIYHKDLVGCGFFFFLFSSALRNRRAGSVWSCAVVLHFEAVQELSGPRASKLIRVPERMRSFCNYFGHVDRSFPVGRRDSVAICGSTLSFRQRGWRDVKILAAHAYVTNPRRVILHARHVLLDCHENIRNDLFFFFAMCVCGIDAARMQRGSDRGLRECTMLRLSACNSQWDE